MQSQRWSDQAIDSPFETAPLRTRRVKGRGSTTTKATNKVMVKCFSLKGIVPFHKIPLPGSTLLSMEVLTHAYPPLKLLFSKMTVPICPLTGRLKYFLPTWRPLTKDQSVLSLVEGFKIPLLKEPKQMLPPKPQQWNKDQKERIDVEVKEMLEKEAIFKVSHQEGELLSEIFLVGKKDGGNRPMINLKNLNKFVPYQHFKMEGSHCLKCLLQNLDYMWKIDLNYAYSSVSLSKESRKWVRFQWEGSWHEFLCLYFGLGPTQRAFYQVIKGSNVNAKAIHDSGNNIPGWHINFRECYGRDTRSTELCNISAMAPRICDKF